MDRHFLMLYDLCIKKVMWTRRILQQYEMNSNKNLSINLFSNKIFLLGDRIIQQISFYGETTFLQNMEYTNPRTKWTRGLKLDDNSMLLTHQIINKNLVNGNIFHSRRCHFEIYSTKSHRAKSVFSSLNIQEDILTVTPNLFIQITRMPKLIYKLRNIQNCRILKTFKCNIQYYLNQGNLNICQTINSNHLIISYDDFKKIYHIINLITSKEKKDHCLKGLLIAETKNNQLIVVQGKGNSLWKKNQSIPSVQLNVNKLKV